MKQSSIPSARAVVSSFEAKGIRRIVISPGSRNAPLTISFTENPNFECYSVVDERCAAFFALGMALTLKEPVAVVCTSGSALLNYYPAIAEAFYSRVPLVVVSADRPPYKIDVGDGQTIRQDHVFERHIGYAANLKIDTSHSRERLGHYAPNLLDEPQEEINNFNNNDIQRALWCALQEKLPVHINVPFEEPLYNTVSTEPRKIVQHNVLQNETTDSLAIQEYTDKWRSSKKKMVLVGVNHPNEIEQKVLENLSKDPSVMVFTETTSNLHHPNFFPSIDSIIFPIEKSANKEVLFQKLRPELLLTFGGLVVSKKIKAFLRAYKPLHHWHIDPFRAFDTYFSLTKHFKSRPNEFLKSLLSKQSFAKSDYFQTWNLVKQSYETKREAYIKELPFSDFLAFHWLSNTIPENYQLHLANSSTVRYAQLFDMKPSLKIFCNRGTSGIDGSTATALGASLVDKEPTVLITGDLSFFYDSNALWNKYIRNDFRIIIINNSGGGIFRILPGNDDSENFETFFETTHNLTAEHVCKQFGFDYRKASNVGELKTVLASFYQASDRPRILEVFTPRKLNDKILLGYFDFIS